MARPFTRIILFCMLCTLGAISLAGCGGSAVGNTSIARIRSVDASGNAGTADIVINGAANDGDQTYFNTANNTPASPYQYIGPQNGVTFTYTTSQPLPAGAVITTNSYNISTGNYYTAFLIGRSDTYSTTPIDPRFLQTVMLPARAPANSSLATLRVLNAAPDAGFTQQTVGGVTTDTVGAVNVTIGSPTVAAFSNVTYATSSSYQTLTPGSNLPVTVTIAAPGSGTVTTATTSISVAPNQVYTLVLTEPNVTTPAYDLKLLSE